MRMLLTILTLIFFTTTNTVAWADDQLIIIDDIADNVDETIEVLQPAAEKFAERPSLAEIVAAMMKVQDLRQRLILNNENYEALTAAETDLNDLLWIEEEWHRTNEAKRLRLEDEVAALRGVVEVIKKRIRAMESLNISLCARLIMPHYAEECEEIIGNEIGAARAGIWVDPNGCDHWIIDDGFEGFLSARINKYGTPVCSGIRPPTVTLDDVESKTIEIIEGPATETD